MSFERITLVKALFTEFRKNTFPELNKYPPRLHVFGSVDNEIFTSQHGLTIGFSFDSNRRRTGQDSLIGLFETLVIEGEKDTQVYWHVIKLFRICGETIETMGEIRECAGKVLDTNIGNITIREIAIKDADGETIFVQPIQIIVDPKRANQYDKMPSEARLDLSPQVRISIDGDITVNNKF